MTETVVANDENDQSCKNKCVRCCEIVSRECTHIDGIESCRSRACVYSIAIPIGLVLVGGISMACLAMITSGFKGWGCPVCVCARF